MSERFATCDSVRRPTAPADISGRVANLIRSWLARMRERRQLDVLSDHVLKDMGLSRFETERESHKRFWRG